MHARVRAAHLPEAVEPLQAIAIDVADHTTQYVAAARAAGGRSDG